MAYFQPSPAYPPPPPKPQRRWGLLIGGIVGAVLSLAVLVIAFIISITTSVASTIDPVAEARTPDVIKFDARAGNYDLYAVRKRGRVGKTEKSIGSSANFECTVTLANGRTIAIDGSVQVVSEEAANTQTIGSFTAVPGETTVACDAGMDGEAYIVDEASAAKQASFYATLIGAALLLASAAAIVAGALWKKPAPAVTPR